MKTPRRNPISCGINHLIPNYPQNLHYLQKNLLYPDINPEQTVDKALVTMINPRNRKGIASCGALTKSASCCEKKIRKKHRQKLEINDIVRTDFVISLKHS